MSFQVLLHAAFIGNHGEKCECGLDPLEDSDDGFAPIQAWIKWAQGRLRVFMHDSGRDAPKAKLKDQNPEKQMLALTVTFGSEVLTR